MILRFLVCIALTIDALWIVWSSATTPTPQGHYYLAVPELLAIPLLWSGLGRRGLITWPLAGLLFLLKGHVVAGLVAIGLVAYNLIGNAILSRRGSVTSTVSDTQTPNGEPDHGQ